MRRVPELVLAVVARFLLGRAQSLARRTHREEGSRGRRRAAPREIPTPEPPRRGPLMLLMLGSFALGLPLMIIFEATLTRILGVGLMFTFIVSGVFLIANPAFLAQEE